MSGGEMAVTAVGIAATAVATYVGLRLVPIEQHLEGRKEARKEEAAVIDRRLQALHDEKRDLERRLNDLEKVAVTRAALDQMRRDMEAAIEKVGDRVMKHFDATAERLEHRIEKVEAAQ